MGAHLRPGRPLRANVENNAEARLAAHHPLIRGLGFFERKISFIEAMSLDWLNRSVSS
jgi:hypothetical protein